MSDKVEEIQIQLKRMDQKKRILMDFIRSLPEEKYRQQPDPKTWSVGQVANHLYLSEKLSLAYLRKKLSYPDTIPGFSIKSWWGLSLVKLVLRTSFKVKAPPKINMWDDQEILSPEELNKNWDQLRKELTSVIMEHMPVFNTHLVYNHPYAGRMTFNQMLIFFNHHIAHHIRQARSIFNKLGTK